MEDINDFIKTIDNRLPLIIFIYYIYLANYWHTTEARLYDVFYTLKCQQVT